MSSPKWLAWLWPILAGVILGAILLAPYMASPVDPSGHTHGAALGALLGLVAAFAINHKPARRSADASGRALLVTIVTTVVIGGALLWSLSGLLRWL